jgi:hypothetical protein
MLVGMISILLTWMLLLMVCCGIGLSIQRLFGLPDLNAERMLSGFWLGWSSLIIALQVLHLVIPVDLPVTLGAVILGMVSLVWNSTSVLRFLKDGARAARLACAATFPFLVWLANRAMGPSRPYDAGLYHLSSVHWISSYPLVPGLGNLHGRLAFNSSYFLFQALLNVGSWKQMSYHLAGGLLITVAFLQIGLGIYRVATRRSRCRLCDLLSALFLIPMIHRSFVDASTTSPDLPIFILGFVVGLQLCRALFEHDGMLQLIFDLFLIATLSALGISIKLSFAAVGCASALVALGKVIAFAGIGLGRRSNLTKVASIVLLPILVLVPWTIRGVVTSGYLAYPSTIVPFDVEWKVRRGQAVTEARAIMTWARQPHGSPDDVLAGWDWLVPWAIRTAESELKLRTVDLALPLLLCLAGILLVVRCRDQGEARPLQLALLLAPSVAALAFWFLAAPAPRFLGAIVWLLGGGTVAGAVKRSGMSRHLAYVALLSLLLAVLVVGADVVRYGFLVRPGPQHGYYPIPEVQTYDFVTDSGLTLHVPAEGDQCWDAPLPCTPYPKPDLRLRRAGDLGSGFTVAPPFGQ